MNRHRPQRSLSHGRPLAIVVLLCGCLSTAPLAAQTLLLIVQTSGSGTPSDARQQARESVADGLFEAGYIVFDDPKAVVTSDASALVKEAQTAGADMLLIVTTELGQTAGTNPTITSVIAFRLIDVKDGAVVAQESREFTNKGREKEVDRAALFREIGQSVAGEIQQALTPHAAGS